MDHLSDIFAKCFHDSEIAKAFSCKRTKAAAVTYNVLEPYLKEEMFDDLKSCKHINTQTPMFSIVVDETTDVSTTSTLAIVTNYLKGFSIVGAQAPSFVGGCRRSSEEAALAQSRAEDMETGRSVGRHSAIELPGHRSYRADTKITCT
ncbi:hypothetical protein ACJJTC_000625 [Scirpophaga incertulas]